MFNKLNMARNKKFVGQRIKTDKSTLRCGITEKHTGTRAWIKLVDGISTKPKKTKTTKNMKSFEIWFFVKERLKGRL